MHRTHWRRLLLATTCGIAIAIGSSTIYAKGGGGHGGSHSSTSVSKSTSKATASKSHSGSKAKHFSSGHRSSRASTRAGKVNISSDHSVRSYYKKDGTFVGSYRATNPNSTIRDNYSANGIQKSAGGTQSATQPLRSAQAASTSARDSKGKIKRSEKAKSDFKRQHPCPSTGASSGACPGYVIDHVQALKHGGADVPSNMQWQTKEAAKQKDKWE